MKELREYVAKQINRIAQTKDTSGGKARLANLRRGAGKVPGELPELWGDFLNGIPDSLLSQSGEVSRGEWAVYLSLTMFALHQQGNSDNVHCEGVSLGRAMSELMKEDTDDERERVLRRFGSLLTAKEISEFSHYLRCIVQLMSAEGIKLDYVKLADDIYSFQSDELRKKVQLRWGQDFYYKKGEE